MAARTDSIELATGVLPIDTRTPQVLEGVHGQEIPKNACTP
ncbi:hypothetical protein [Mycobacterium sp. ACS4331]